MRASSPTFIHKVVILGRGATDDPRLLADYFHARRASAPVSRGMTPVGEVIEPEPLQPGPALRELTDWRRGQSTLRNVAQSMYRWMAGDDALAELVYSTSRRERPEIVVETGVATGVTTAYALAGLADNQLGLLHSIDLPPLGLVAAGLLAHEVPLSLRGRWRYHWGSSRRLLPTILARSRGQLGLFIHDSDHSYSNMYWEMSIAWSALQPGGYLIVDDADLHSAVADFAAAASADLRHLHQHGEPGFSAILKKHSQTR